MSRPNWPGLDGLRAVAVVLVIGYHADSALGNGFVGVDVFFVLSGFLITSLLLGEAEQTGRVRVGAFYLRRVLRLYPALVVLCAAVTAMAAVLGVRVAQVAAGAAASVGYVANIWEYSGHDTYLLQHTWTLSLEEQFYLLWPALLVLILRARWTAWLVIAGWVSVEIADAVLGQPAVLHTYIRAAGLPLGCALAFALRHERVRGWLHRASAPLAVPALLGIVVIACLRGDLGAWTEGWPASLPAVLTVPVVVAVIGASTALARSMTHPALVWIGRRSYGLYLWHFPILSALINHGPHQVPMTVRVVAGVVATFVVAAASYRFVELPFLRVKQRFEPEQAPAVPERAQPQPTQAQP